MQNKKQHIDILEELVRISILKENADKGERDQLFDQVIDKTNVDYVPKKSFYKKFVNQVSPSANIFSTLLNLKLILPIAFSGIVGVSIIFLKQKTPVDNIPKVVESIQDITVQLPDVVNPAINTKVMDTINTQIINTPSHNIRIKSKPTRFNINNSSDNPIKITNEIGETDNTARLDNTTNQTTDQENNEPVITINTHTEINDKTDKKTEDKKEGILNPRIKYEGKNQYVIFFKQKSEKIYPGSLKVLENMLDELDSKNNVEKILINLNIKRKFLFFSNKKLAEKRMREFKREIRQNISKESKYSRKIRYTAIKKQKLHQSKYRDDFIRIEVFYKK